MNDRPLDVGGGTEVYVDRLARALTAAGDEVSLFAGEVVHDGWRRILDLWDPRAREAVRRRSEGAQVIHLHNVLRELSPSVLGASEVPTVLTVHDHRLLGVHDDATPQIRRSLDGLLRPFHRREIRRAVQAVVAVSEPLAADLSRMLGRQVVYVPAPVPPPAVPPHPPAGGTDVVFVGRIHRDKGVDVLAHAFARIAGDHPDSRLVLVGEGSDRERLAGLAPWVRATGRRAWEEVSRELGRARVVAVPSVRPEGTPLVALEAAMHGRPVVASDDPGLRAAVTRLQAGELVPAGDVGRLAEALDGFLADPDRAAEVGAVAGSNARRLHDPATVAARTREIYAAAGATGV